MVTLEDCLAAFFAADELKGWKTQAVTQHYDPAMLQNNEQDS